MSITREKQKLGDFGLVYSSVPHQTVRGHQHASVEKDDRRSIRLHRTLNNLIDGLQVPCFKLDKATKRTWVAWMPVRLAGLMALG